MKIFSKNALKLLVLVVANCRLLAAFAEINRIKVFYVMLTMLRRVISSFLFYAITVSTVRNITTLILSPVILKRKARNTYIHNSNKNCERVIAKYL